jgi:hypothetical protein
MGLTTVVEARRGRVWRGQAWRGVAVKGLTNEPRVSRLRVARYIPSYKADAHGIPKGCSKPIGFRNGRLDTFETSSRLSFPQL